MHFSCKLDMFTVGMLFPLDGGERDILCYCVASFPSVVGTQLFV